MRLWWWRALVALWCRWAGGCYADLFAGWGLPVVVARTGLGTINHTLMTVEALRARGRHCGDRLCRRRA
jgi:hypothetical protein